MKKTIRKKRNTFLLALLVIFFSVLGACNPNIVDNDSSSSSSTSDNSGNRPVFSIGTGYYYTDQDLTITGPAGAEIYFKIMGPGDTSADNIPYTSYTGPIDLDGPGITYTVIAYTENSSGERSAEISKTYEITGTLFLSYEVLNEADVTSTGAYPQIVFYCRDRNGNDIDGATILYTDQKDVNPDAVARTGIPFFYDGTIDTAIYLKDSLSLNAVAFKERWQTSGIVSLTRTLQVPRPYFNPQDETVVNQGDTYQIFCGLDETNIFYKQFAYQADMSDLTTDELITAYTQGETLSITKPIRVVAYATRDDEDWRDSEMEEVAYKMQLPTPVSFPAQTPGTQHTTTQYVSFSYNSIPDSSVRNLIRVRYTLDDSEPTTDSTLYVPNVDPAIPISETTTLRAFAYVEGDIEGNTYGWTPSEELSEAFLFKIREPSIGLVSDTYDTTKDCSITADVGVDVYYFLTSDADATFDTVSGTPYNDTPIVIDPSTIDGGTHIDENGVVYLKVKAYRQDSTTDCSDMVERAYTFKLAAPSFTPSPALNQIFTEQIDNVLINHALLNYGATIMYGRDTNPINTLYDRTTDVIMINQTTTLKAFARKLGWQDSNNEVQTYSYKPNPPLFEDSNLDSTIRLYREPVILTAVTTNAGVANQEIWYTDNSSDPTDAANPDRNMLTNGQTLPELTRSTTIRAAIRVPGWGYSDIITNEYILKVQEPVLNLVENAANKTYECTFTSTTTGSRIYYTTDGQDPTSDSSSVASGQTITLDRNSHIRAVAVKPDWSSATWENSDVREATVEITMNTPVIIVTVNDVQTAVTPVGNVYTLPLDDDGYGPSNWVVKAQTNLNDGSGRSINYTIDGLTDPTSDVGQQYANPISMQKPYTELRMIAWRDGCTSSAIETIIIRYQVQTPTFNIGENIGGVNHSNPVVNDADGRIIGTDVDLLTLTTATDNATIEYAIRDTSGNVIPGFPDGETPGNNESISVPLTHSGFTVAITGVRTDAAGDWVDSETVTAAFYRKLDPPVISCPEIAGAIPTVTDADVIITDNTANVVDSTVTMHYNFDGLASPSGSFTGVFTRNITSGTTVNASASKAYWIASDGATPLIINQCAAPVLSPPTGTTFSQTSDDATRTVTITSSGNTIDYNLNSAGYTTSNSFIVAQNSTVTARARRDGYLANTTTAGYFVKLPTPTTLSQASGYTFPTPSGIVTITNNVSGGTIEYSISGGAWTAGTNVSITGPTTVQVRVTKAGFEPSDPSGNYTYNVTPVVIP